MANYFNISCRILTQLNKPLFTQQWRAASLFSNESLGIDKYLFVRNKVSSQMVGFEDKFRIKMKEFVAKNSENIFTEDLKQIIHIGQIEDLPLISEMVTKFNSNNKGIRFGSFVFGPVVMRMYHFLDVPDEALKMFESPKNEGFFDQLVSYHILLDLLYKHEKYEDMFKTFEYIKQKQIQMSKYPRNVITLVMAACYKKNTQDSFEYASKLWSNLFEIGHTPTRKAATFFAGLALAQGAPNVAVEVVSTIKQQQYVSARNLKVIALSDLDRPENALPILRSVLDNDAPNVKNTFTQDTLDRVAAAVERSSNVDTKREFSQILKGIQTRNLIETKTLDSILCQEIQQIVFNTTNQPLHTSYQNNRKITERTSSREGLRHMY